MADDDVTKKIKLPQPAVDLPTRFRLLVSEGSLGPPQLGYETRLINDHNNERHASIFMWWEVDEKGLPPGSGGWKMHVTARADQVIDVACLVLPILCGLEVPHKVVATREYYEQQLMGKQRGKFITVYSRNLEEGKAALKEIDSTLLQYADEGLLRPGPRPLWRDSAEQQAEWPLGASGFVSTSWHKDYRKD
jgi:hypothetical protein